MTKILPLYRKDEKWWCGSSVTSLNASANLRMVANLMGVALGLARCCVWGLTFEFTRPEEEGVVSPTCDDATAGTRRAYNACRSGSGVQRVVRQHSRRLCGVAQSDEIDYLGERSFRASTRRAG